MDEKYRQKIEIDIRCAIDICFAFDMLHSICAAAQERFHSSNPTNNRESLKTHVVMQKEKKYGKIVLQGGVSNAIRNMG